MQEKVIVGVFASQICDRRSGAWAKESGLAPVPIGLVEGAGAIFHHPDCFDKTAQRVYDGRKTVLEKQE